MRKARWSRPLVSVSAGLVFHGCSILVASAQSLEPMQGEINSFAGQFAVQVYPGNPYSRPMKIFLRAYDADFRPITAIVHPQTVLIGAKEKRRVIVIIPFEDKAHRNVKICAESYPLSTLHTRIRTQVCGRFTARRLG